MLREYRVEVCVASGYVLHATEEVPGCGRPYVDVCMASFVRAGVPLSHKAGIDYLEHARGKNVAIIVTGRTALSNTCHDYLECGETHLDEALARHDERRSLRGRVNGPDLFNNVSNHRHVTSPYHVVIADRVEFVS